MSRKIALSGLLTALCFLLSYLEFLMPLTDLRLPGAKIGLANICVLFALYRLGVRYAAGIDLARIVLNWLFFGSFTALVYSAVGAALSIAVEAALIRSDKFSEIGVSAAGGAMHNLGQVLAAAVLLGRGAIGYLPALMVTGTAAGAVNGVVLRVVLKRVRANVNEKRKKED